MKCEVVANQVRFDKFYYCRTHKVECPEFGCKGFEVPQPTLIPDINEKKKTPSDTFPDYGEYYWMDKADETITFPVRGFHYYGFQKNWKEYKSYMQLPNSLGDSWFYVYNDGHFRGISLKPETWELTACV